MMKKYIILTPTVCGMGGAELYTLRRAQHLMQEGYSVYLIIARKYDYFPLKDAFQDIPIIIEPLLVKYYASIDASESSKIIDRIIEQIGRADEYLFESHSLSMVEWGELISHKLSAKHLAYLLAEPKVSKYRFNPGRSIIFNKLEKGELYGCTSVSLKLIFERDNVPCHYVNVGFDDAELSEKSYPALNLYKEPDDFVITTVGRLDKEYMEPFIKNTILFAQSHPERNFLLVVGGGSQVAGCEEHIKSIAQEAIDQNRNLRIELTGYIEKLGKDFFSFSDVFVGLGTATLNSISQSCLTINIDPTDYRTGRVSGFFGTDTKNFAYSESGKLYTLQEKLEEAFTLKGEQLEAICNAGRKTYEENFKTDVCMKKLDSIFDSIIPPVDSEIIRISPLYRFYVRIGMKAVAFRKSVFGK